MPFRIRLGALQRALAQFQDNLARLSAIVSDRASHPEIADVVIDRPVFILGLPRCGTSILHALIGADPQVRTPLQWEVAAPSPPPEAATFDSDPRADGFDAYVAACRFSCTTGAVAGIGITIFDAFILGTF